MAKVAWGLVQASIAVALVATLWFVVVTLPVRIPYWGEAEVVFEASRLRSHLPLYVDPLVGAAEYGEPVSRFYVTYPPLFAWIVSLAPANVALVFGRLACSLAWFGALASFAWTARRESRREAVAAAAFIGGVWVLANFATIGRPDAMACAIAAFALDRAMRRGTIDIVSVALFVLVPWVKPTIVGLPAGALAGVCLVDRKAAPRVIGAAAALVVVSAGAAHLASGGALFMHVVRSNAQPFTLTSWLDQVPARLPFFAPLFLWAAWVGWRARHEASARIGLSALGCAVAWTLFALAKTGSSSNYWMEPAIAALVLIARTPAGPVRIGGDNLLHAVVALVCVLWADVASVRGAFSHGQRMRADAAFIDTVRTRLALSDGDLIAADEAGIELIVNGRILTPTYQMVHLVRSGAYPAWPWVADLSSRNTGAFIEHTGQLRLAPELARTLEERFVLAFEERGFRVWKRR